MINLLVVLLVLNVIGIVIMDVDKQRAKEGSWRIPESRLWLVGILGGGIGLYLGMQMFRHKTKHNSFKYGVPFVIVVNILSYAYIIYTLS